MMIVEGVGRTFSKIKRRWKKDAEFFGSNSGGQIFLGSNWGPSQPATIRRRVVAGPNRPHEKEKRDEADGVDAVQPRRRRPPGHPAGSRRRAGLPPLQEASQVGKRARKGGVGLLFGPRAPLFASSPLISPRLLKCLRESFRRAGTARPAGPWSATPSACPSR